MIYASPYCRAKIGKREHTKDLKVNSTTPYMEQRSKHPKSKSSNVFTAAVLFGVAGFILATSLPGSFDGGLGLMIGFVVSFPVLTTALVVSTTRLNNKIAAGANVRVNENVSATHTVQAPVNTIESASSTQSARSSSSVRA